LKKDPESIHEASNESIKKIFFADPRKNPSGHKKTSSCSFKHNTQKISIMADLPFSTSKKDQPVKIRMGEGFAGIEAKTTVEIFDEVVAKFGDKPALHQKVLKEVSPK
jgi:hypothetical protein